MNCELLPLWQKGELLTTQRLNRQVRAINFLLKTLGAVIPRIALASYNPVTETSFPGLINGIYTCASIPKPCIENGAIFLPESSLNSAVWDSAITSPQVVDGVLHLNPAADLQPGYVDSILFDAAEGSPSLQSGAIHLPAAGDNSPGFLSAIEYIEYATSPSICLGKIRLNPADSTREPTPGYVKSVAYNSSLSSPVIENGEIQINPAYYDPADFVGASTPGYIKSVGYNSSLTAPVINSGDIQLNPADVDVPGYVHSIEYTPDSTIPDIYQGKIRINPAYYDPADFAGASTPGYIKSVGYNSSLTAPVISGGDIQLNPAYHDPSDSSADSRPGYVTSAEVFEYDPSNASVSDAEKQPRIIDGKIIIPLPEQSFSVEYVFDVGATPGTDGWVQTLYIWGLYTGNLDHMYATRQLMRFAGNTLQVVQQISYDGNTWSDSSANG